MSDQNVVVQTHPVRVRIFMRNGTRVTGLAHIQPGAYQKRISDVLNLGAVRYIAVTEAMFEAEGEGKVDTHCMLVNVQDISMVDVTPPSAEDMGKAEPLLGEPGLPGASS